MNNFINVRLQAYNNTKQLNILKHNTRKIESLSKLDEFKTNYVVLNDGELFDLKEKLTRDTLYNTLKKFYDKDRKVHNEKMYERRQRNLTNQQASWMEGVFTFSEAIKSDLGNKYTIEDLSRVANNCAQDLAKQLNSNLKYLLLHMDETTPHFHFALKNFDDKGHSIFHKIKHKEILAKIQDLAFKHFGELGMDRGISKELTGKNYQTISNYYKSKEIELKTIISSLQQDVKQIQEAKKNIKNDLDLTTSEKKQELDKLDLEIKSLRNTMNEYKTIKNDNDIKLKAQQDEISAANDTLNDLNAKINIKTKEVDNFDNINKSIDKGVEKLVDDLIENPLTLLGKDAILDIDTLKDKTKEQLRKALKVDIKSKEVQEKDKIIKEQSDLILSKDKEIALKDKTIEKATKDTQKLEKAFLVNFKALEAMKKDFKTKVANRVRRINLMNKLKKSSIASKIRNRLSQKFKENKIDR